MLLRYLRVTKFVPFEVEIAFATEGMRDKPVQEVMSTKIDSKQFDGLTGSFCAVRVRVR